MADITGQVPANEAIATTVAVAYAEQPQSAFWSTDAYRIILYIKVQYLDNSTQKKKQIYYNTSYRPKIAVRPSTESNIAS